VLRHDVVGKAVSLWFTCQEPEGRWSDPASRDAVPAWATSASDNRHGLLQDTFQGVEHAAVRVLELDGPSAVGTEGRVGEARPVHRARTRARPAHPRAWCGASDPNDSESCQVWRVGAPVRIHNDPRRRVVVADPRGDTAHRRLRGGGASADGARSVTGRRNQADRPNGDRSRDDGPHVLSIGQTSRPAKPTPVVPILCIAPAGSRCNEHEPEDDKDRPDGQEIRSV